MFLNTKDGIICDYCGVTYKDQFIYYSTRSIKYSIVKNQRSAPQDAGLHSDMCSNCYEELLEQVKKFIGHSSKNKIKCDLSNTYGVGTFDYYVLYFDKIDVDKDRGADAIRSEKNVMDLNIIKGFDELVQKTQVIRTKIEQQGAWA